MVAEVNYAQLGWKEDILDMMDQPTRLHTDETQTLFVILDPGQLAEFREIRTLRFQLTIYDAVSGEVLGTVPVRARLQVTLPA